jgi:hypothetical protein
MRGVVFLVRRRYACIMFFGALVFYPNFVLVVLLIIIITEHNSCLISVVWALQIRCQRVGNLTTQWK